MNELLPLGTKVDIALGRCLSLLETSLIVKDGELVYTDQPDQGPPFLGIYGASCATIALIASGMKPDNILIRQLLEYLCKHQLDSGGWTIRNVQPVGLTTACTFSLIAFGLASIQTEQERETVRKAIEWLINNSNKSGWPFFEEGLEIAVTPTALAVNALCKVKPYLSSRGRQVLDDGCSALTKAFSPEGFVPNRTEPSIPCVAATSLALITLVGAGYKVYTDPIARGLEWLKRQTDWSHDNSDSFYARRTTGTVGHPNYDHVAGHVNYVHFTPALMLQALLACEIDIVTEPIAKSLVDNLLSTQRETGDWRSLLAPKETPTWMVMDGALALSHFAKALLEIKPTLPFRDETLHIKAEVKAIVDHSTESYQHLNTQIQRIEAVLLSHERKLQMLSPMLNLVRWCLFFLPLILVFIGYILLKVYLPKIGWIIEALTVLLSIISIGLGILSIRRDLSREEKIDVIEGRNITTLTGGSQREEALVSLRDEDRVETAKR
jgi:hypothetical protein